MLQLAASLERASEHPLAEAIVDGAADRGVSLADASEFDSRTGRGVVGRIEGRVVGIGNLKLMAELGVAVGPLARIADEMRAEAQTVMFLAVSGELAGLLGVADPIKASTPEALRGLQEEGLRVVMLTGDNPRTAQAVAERLGLDDVADVDTLTTVIVGSSETRLVSGRSDLVYTPRGYGAAREAHRA